MNYSTTQIPLNRRIFRIALWLFIASIGLSVLGTLLLKVFPSTGPFFAPYMDRLVNTPTWVYMALLPVLSFTLFFERLGWTRSLLFLAIGTIVGAAAELIGTQTGFPFGEYAYTHRLGPMIAGHVPYFIPLSWYALSILCYDLSRRLNWGVIGRVIGTAVLMILWDVSLDPAMNQGGGTFVFWLYPEGGTFFGMPWINWFGWFITSLVIGIGFELVGGLKEAADDQIDKWSPILYSLHLLFPIAICFLYGLPIAGFLGLVALAIPFVLIRFRNDDSSLVVSDNDR